MALLDILNAFLESGIIIYVIRGDLYFDLNGYDGEKYHTACEMAVAYGKEEVNQFLIQTYS